MKPVEEGAKVKLRHWKPREGWEVYRYRPPWKGGGDRLPEEARLVYAFSGETVRLGPYGQGPWFAGPMAKVAEIVWEDEEPWVRFSLLPWALLRKVRRPLSWYPW